MRHRTHSLRMIVSLLLGVALCVSPMANIALASDQDPLLTSNFTPISGSQTPCKNVVPQPLFAVNFALAPSQFERVDTPSANKLVITSPKEVVPGSFMPVQTVLKKVTDEDLSSDVVITPSPSPVPTTNVFPIAMESSQVTAAVSGSVLNSSVLFDLVNVARAQYGLPAFQKNDQVCQVASARAPEIDNEIWVTHNMHAGFFSRNLPYWATENLISMQNETAALNWWLNSPVHRAAVLGNWQYACVGCAGRSCSMIFSNLEPKYIAPPASQTDPAPSPSSSSHS